MIKFSLMWLLGCASQLQIEDSNKEGFAPPYPPEPPPTLGVNIEEGCDQAAIGSKVCNLVLLDQHDEYWELYDHKGKVILLDFSTIWCGPCQSAGYFTQGIQNDYGDQIVFATIIIEGLEGLPATLEDAQVFADGHSTTTAPVLQGSRDYAMDQQGITGYLVGGFPTYVYIDQELKIHLGHVGFNDEYIRMTLDSFF